MLLNIFSYVQIANKVSIVNITFSVFLTIFEELRGQYSIGSALIDIDSKDISSQLSSYFIVTNCFLFGDKTPEEGVIFLFYVILITYTLFLHSEEIKIEYGTQEHSFGLINKNSELY